MPKSDGAGDLFEMDPEFNFDSLENAAEEPAGNKPASAEAPAPPKIKGVKATSGATGDRPQQARSTRLIRTQESIYRRAFSETQLLDIFPGRDAEIKDGQAWHIITGGDIDALSAVKAVLRQQPLEYLLLSTWAMAAEDVLQIGEWLAGGEIKKADAYVGEIFPGSYRGEYNLLKPIIEAYGGRVCVFRNHAKILAGYGPRFYFATAGSGNIGTNPRTENMTINIGRDIFDFYKAYFDGIKSFV